jgi:hypothetical protein
MHLTTGFIDISDIHQRFLFTPPPSARPRVAYTLQRVLCSHRYVDAIVGLPAFYHDNHRCFIGSPVFLAAERPSLGGACDLCVVREGSHPALYYWTSAVF